LRFGAGQVERIDGNVVRGNGRPGRAQLDAIRPHGYLSPGAWLNGSPSQGGQWAPSQPFSSNPVHQPSFVIRSAEAGMIGGVDETDADRLELLDRIAERVPELKLGQYEIEWSTLPDGHEALHIGRGGDYFANCGEDLHAYGSLAPIVPGCIGCIVIYPDGSRQLVHVQPDPLAQ
jgi:hypothetical protein